MDFYEYWKELNKIALNEELLYEGTGDYRKKAVKILADSGLYSEEVADRIIGLLTTSHPNRDNPEQMDHPDIEAFMGQTVMNPDGTPALNPDGTVKRKTPNYFYKYIPGMATQLVKYANGSTDRAHDFLLECPGIYDYYLKYWVQPQREAITNDKDKVNFDKEFENLTYEQVKEKVESIREEQGEKDKEALGQMTFSGNNSDYDLIPIDSFEQMHSAFGGHWTGDGQNDHYAGDGGTAWCHTGSKNVYNGGSWVDGGKKKFFVLAKKGWKQIQCPERQEDRKPRDEYDNSLMALLVNVRSHALEKCTGRYNHVAGGAADNKYTGYADLSAAVGFNVKEAIDNVLGEIQPINWSTFDGSRDWLVNQFDDPINEVSGAVNIPEGVTKLESNIFAGFSNLSSISLPNSLTAIGEGAFKDCMALESVVMGDSVSFMGSNVFFNCKALKSVKLSNSLETIPANTFRECSALESINIPNSVTEIGTEAFGDCTNLKKVVLPDSVTNLGKEVFICCFSLQFLNLGGAEEIGEGICYKCKSLKKVVIPPTATSIGYGAFGLCISLESANIPGSVQEIDEKAFKGCKSLKSVSLGQGIRRIGKDAFSRCDIESIAIPASVEGIEDGAFAHCSNLKNISVANPDTEIVETAFYGCPGAEQ